MGRLEDTPAGRHWVSGGRLRANLAGHQQSRSGPGDTNRTLYSLRRFVRLAASGNQSILMCFWAPVISVTEDGLELRALGDAFVGRHVVPRYRGYMQAQAERLVGIRGSGHGKRGSGQRQELVNEHGYDTKFAMHCARLGFQGLELLSSGRLQLPIEGEPAEWLRAVRRGEVPFAEWWERSLVLDAKLEAMAVDESLPAGADRERIEACLVAVHLRA
jgi:hypothetical protein